MAPIIPFTTWAGISPLPPASSAQAHHFSRLAEVSFCALTRLLSPHLTMPRVRHVGGVSSGPSRLEPGVARQLANPLIYRRNAINKDYGTLQEVERLGKRKKERKE